PPFAGELHAILIARRRGEIAIEIDWQHVADGRTVIAAFAERFLAAEHQEPAAAATDKLRQQRKLVLLEELRLDVVEDNCVIAEQRVLVLGKPAPKLLFVFGTQAN